MVTPLSSLDNITPINLGGRWRQASRHRSLSRCPVRCGAGAQSEALGLPPVVPGRTPELALHARSVSRRHRQLCPALERLLDGLLSPAAFHLGREALCVLDEQHAQIAWVRTCVIPHLRRIFYRSNGGDISSLTRGRRGAFLLFRMPQKDVQGHQSESVQGLDKESPKVRPSLHSLHPTAGPLTFF